MLPTKKWQAKLLETADHSLWSRMFVAIIYHAIWTPIIGKVLPVKRELTNDYDHFAVAVLIDAEVVGHVPRSLSKTTSFFLRYDGNVVFCEVTGERVNRGVQLGVEVPCIYKFCGRRSHITKLKELV